MLVNLICTQFTDASLGTCTLHLGEVHLLKESHGGHKASLAQRCPTLRCLGPGCAAEELVTLAAGHVCQPGACTPKVTQ